MCYRTICYFPLNCCWLDKSLIAVGVPRCLFLPVQYSFTLGVGGVDPVNNIILYIIILYIIHTYTAYCFPIRAACVVKINISIWCWCLRQQSLWRHDNAFNDASFRCINFSTPQKMGRQILSIFWTGYPMDDPRKRSNFRENLTTSFREIFWNRKYFVRAPPLQGVRMLRFYFWVLKGLQLHKKFRVPRTSHFGDIRGQSFNFPTFTDKTNGKTSISMLPPQRCSFGKCCLLPCPMNPWPCPLNPWPWPLNPWPCPLNPWPCPLNPWPWPLYPWPWKCGPGSN